MAALATAALAACLSSSLLAQTPDAIDPEQGRRIYRQGVLPSGRPLTARSASGELLADAETLRCASCHRLSGLGSGEGGAYVLPVAAPDLFSEVTPDRSELLRELYQEVQSDTVRARHNSPRLRPAYTEESLTETLQSGVDPSGRRLDPLMPRYDLSSADAGHLIAYLKTLGTTPDPGVDDEVIRFATVIAGPVAAEKRAALIDVIAAYVDYKNASVRGHLARPGFSPRYKDEIARSFRRWEHEVWTLEGDEESWLRQLDEHYLRRPVFALLSGLSAGSWQPVHEFCEGRRVPCLFPLTHQPSVATAGLYSLYLSRGLVGEAEALANHLGARIDKGELDTVIQVFGDGREKRLLASSFNEALGVARAEHLISRPLDGGQPLEELAPGAEPVALVLWLDGDETSRLVLEGSATAALDVYASFDLLGGEPPKLTPELLSRTRILYPYELPGREAPRLYRLRAWLRSRGVERGDEKLQLGGHFALAVADSALAHMLEHFSRDYFIERVEHETENSLNPGIYPRLSLGPGQRFASKGCYLVALGPDGEIREVGEWIVPSAEKGDSGPRR